MSSKTLKDYAQSLNESRLNREPRTQITAEYSDLTVNEAYQIQAMGIDFRRTQSEHLVGMKMGLTSEAKRRQMDLDAPCFGYLTDKMRINSGDTLKLKDAIHLKIEPEVAFFFEEDIHAEMTRDELISRCTGVAPALEILDTRYEAFKYFSLEDVVADNSSSFKFVLGEPQPLEGKDLMNMTLEMSVNDQIVETGKSEAISGDPMKSVEQLLELTKRFGQTFESPGFVLAGAATPAYNLEPGIEVKLHVTGLSEISLKVEA